MMKHRLTVSMQVPRPRAEVFGFFAEANNLEAITPPELHFRIVSPQPIIIQKDTYIEYQLRLFGISFSWLTRITHWNPPQEFVDEQVQGPYKQWIHTHSFTEVNGGTEISDEVQYQLPFFPLGELAYPLVHLQLQRIFAYRQKRIQDIFSGHLKR
ncbi:MAG: SRPBCC family protein [Desulfobacteraceae bacterium]